MSQNCALLAGAKIKAFLVESIEGRCTKMIKVHILDLASLHPIIYPKEIIMAVYSSLAKRTLISELFITVKFGTN